MPQVIDGDEAVITALADESDLPSIRRPPRTGIVAAQTGELMSWNGSAHRSDPELPVGGPHRELAVGRELHIFALFLRAAHRPATGEGRRPPRPPTLPAFVARLRGRIRHAPTLIRLTAANVNERAAIRCDAQAGDGQPFITRIPSYLPGGEVRASATQRLRTPLASNTQATRPLCDAATRFEGKGELITCSRVNVEAAAARTDKRHRMIAKRNETFPDRGKMHARDIRTRVVCIGEEPTPLIRELPGVSLAEVGASVLARAGARAGAPLRPSHETLRTLYNARSNKVPIPMTAFPTEKMHACWRPVAPAGSFLSLVAGDNS